MQLKLTNLQNHITLVIEHKYMGDYMIMITQHSFKVHNACIHHILHIQHLPILISSTTTAKRTNETQQTLKTTSALAHTGDFVNN